MRLPYEIDRGPCYSYLFMTFRSGVVVFCTCSRTVLNAFCWCVVWFDSCCCWRKHRRRVTSSVHPLLQHTAAGRAAVTREFSDLSFRRSCLTSTAIGSAVLSRRTVPAGDLRPSGKLSGRRTAPTSLFVCTYATSRACPARRRARLRRLVRQVCLPLAASSSFNCCCARSQSTTLSCDGVCRVAADNVRNSLCFSMTIASAKEHIGSCLR